MFPHQEVNESRKKKAPAWLMGSSYCCRLAHNGFEHLSKMMFAKKPVHVMQLGMLEYFDTLNKLPRVSAFI
jgi:hypothetical protein